MGACSSPPTLSARGPPASPSSDDEVRAAFATRASRLLVTAVGAPTYRPTPGGQPGRPTELIHFETLMARVEDRSRQQPRRQTI
jgi:hypothetical protein